MGMQSLFRGITEPAIVEKSKLTAQILRDLEVEASAASAVYRE